MGMLKFKNIAIYNSFSFTVISTWRIVWNTNTNWSVLGDINILENGIKIPKDLGRLEPGSRLINAYFLLNVLLSAVYSGSFFFSHNKPMNQMLLTLFYSQ